MNSKDKIITRIPPTPEKFWSGDPVIQKARGTVPIGLDFEPIAAQGPISAEEFLDQPDPPTHSRSVLKRLVDVLGAPFIWLRGYFVGLVERDFFRNSIELRTEMLDLDNALAAFNIAYSRALQCWHNQNFSLFEHWMAESEKLLKVFQQLLDAWKCKYGSTVPPNQIRFSDRSKMPTPDKAA
jgi:hypothetical protein